MEEKQVAQNENSETKDWSGLKLNYPRTIKVGLGFCVVMIFWTVYNFVVPLLLEQAFGFSNTIRNLIVGIASALCIFLLPYFGKKSDRCKSKYGRRTPFVVVGTAISIIAMVLIPLSVSGQLKESGATRTEYKNFFLMEDSSTLTPDGALTKSTREALLGSWWDSAEDGDFSFVEKSTYDKMISKYDSSQDARAQFTQIYNAQVKDNRFLGIFGKATEFHKFRTYVDADNKVVSGEKVEIDKNEYNSLKTMNENYSNYLKYGADEYTSSAVNSNMKTSALVFFIIALLLVIVSQTLIRTPAVSLMPDITPSPLRSPGNAMINLIGGVGGAVGFLIYTVTFMFEDKLSLPTQYWIIFGAMALALAVVLALFLLLVKEKEWVAENQLICEKYGLETGNEEKEDAPPVNILKQYGKEKMTSFFLILGAISMWFIGYYAISTNLAVYAVKVLELGSGLASIVSGASMLVAAIGFIPVGILARKIGRRWSIVLGFMLAIVSFVLVGIFVTPSSSSKMVVFTLFYLISGFGLIFANVNTLPMVLELSTPRDVGKFTGYYYMATMTAQTLGPIFGGLVMDHISSRGIFFFAAICISIGAILMLFVKHGESPDFAVKGSKKKAAV